MKKITLSCLLAFALLLPSFAAKNNLVNFKSKAVSFNKSKVITIGLEGTVLIANSDAKSGTLMEVDIYDANNDLVRVQRCSGYSAQVNLTGLPAGEYSAEVIAAYQKQLFPFYY